MLNLDTHILLFAVTGDLSPQETQMLRSHPWSISAIVLWEVAKLAQLGRIEGDLDDRKVQRVLRSVYLWPITADIARTSTRLDIQGDPADELIGATSIVHQVPLITRDRNLLRSQRIPLVQDR
jgi:PIN domain nuclease of toxin-antitoxin system